METIITFMNGKPTTFWSIVCVLFFIIFFLSLNIAAKNCSRSGDDGCIDYESWPKRKKVLYSMGETIALLASIGFDTGLIALFITL